MNGTHVIRTESRDTPVKVSVIVPCYKVEDYLPKCLDSLIAQSLSEIEIICINDGSPDHCIDILHDYYSLYPTKLVIIDKANEGVWRGRFDAIRLARGEYVGFVDSDDYVAPNFCKQMYSAAVEKNADIVVCGFHRIEASTGRILTTEMTNRDDSFQVECNPERLLELNGAPWNKFFRADLLKNLRDLSVPPRIFDDMIMHLLAFTKTRNVTFVNEALVYYVIRDGSIMTTIDQSKILSAYNAMIEVKNIYLESNLPQTYLSFLDSAAFLHLGISLMFRVSYDRQAVFSDVIRENERFLQDNFSSWSTNGIISISNARKFGGVFSKLLVARLIYKAHLMDPALRLYKTSIEKLRIDIKW